MPVRSSICTYSPSSGGFSTGPTATTHPSSKYSSILPTTSSLSYGQYKPLGSSSSSRTSFRTSPTTPTTSSSVSTTSSPLNRSSFTSRYNLTASPSSYNPSTGSSSAYNSSTLGSSSNSNTNSSNVGLYKPLDSPYVSKYGNNLRAASTTGLTQGQRYSSSSSSNSLSSTSSHDTYNSSTGASYKSPSSSAYSSGSSLSSSSSNNSTSSSSSSTSGYVPRSRRLSYTSYSATSSLASHRSSPGSSPATPPDTQLPANVPSGLINLGNTCYMNASLQSLYAIDSFRELILSGSLLRLGDSGDKVLTQQLVDLFKLMKNQRSSSQTAVSPADFKYTFSRYQSKFSGFGQQDAQEFLRYLINGVHEESNKVNQSRNQRRTSCSSRHAPRTAQEAWLQYRDIVDNSPLVDLLVGQFCSTITCSQCGNKSHCWDPFWDLSLPLTMRKSGGASSAGNTRYTYTSNSSCSLRDVLDEFTAKETLDSDERPTCSQCKEPTRSTKQLSWSRLPQVLVLHLKKFTNDGYKLSSADVQIDKQLTFNGTTTYQLRACISHHGHSSCSGHYTAHCEYANRWFHFNDDRVRDVSATFDTKRLDDAYVLLYTPVGVTSQSKL